MFGGFTSHLNKVNDVYIGYCNNELSVVSNSVITVININSSSSSCCRSGFFSCNTSATVIEISNKVLVVVEVVVFFY
jgi:hypothetical protein